MLKVLIVGCGNIAGGFDAARPAGAPPLTHAGAYRAHGGFELAGCVEPDAARRAAFMAHWGVTRGYADFAAAGAGGERFDVISICSPTSAHHADALAALALRPSLVFGEKPLCDTVGRAEDLVARFQVEGVKLAVNHNRRWDADVRRLRGEVAAGAWGQLRCATGHYNKGILNNGSHLVDLLHCLAGPLELLHAGRPVHDFWPADPSVPALLQTANGAPVSLNCSHAADYSLFELQLVFERGLVAMEDGGLRWRVRHAGPSEQFAGYRALSAGDLVQGHYLDAMGNAAANIYDAVTNQAELASTGETALAAQRLCDQIARAAAPTP
jgi:predicted dehydrogenase